MNPELFKLQTSQQNAQAKLMINNRNNREQLLARHSNQQAQFDSQEQQIVLMEFRRRSVPISDRGTER